MKKILYFALIAGFSISCSQTKSDFVEGLDDGMTVSETTTEIPVISVDVFDAEAGKYVDGKVEIAGIVDHVCKHSGKKLKLVTDGGSVHVESETRFDDALVGNEIQLTGIVRELRVDESYCLQMEEDNTKKHRSGEMNDEQMGNQHKMIQHYRDSMAVAGVDHLSFYTLEFVALEKDTE